MKKNNKVKIKHSFLLLYGAHGPEFCRFIELNTPACECTMHSSALDSMHYFFLSLSFTRGRNRDRSY